MRSSKKSATVILVMGATGAGKSSFINTVLKQQTMTVGRELESCTSNLNCGYLKTIEGDNVQDCQIKLVDTPGFDNALQDDFEILKKIATWLKDSSKQGEKLGGIIYLQDITTPRFDASARRNLQILQSLCDENVLAHVVLGTTKWGLNVPGSEERQRQLETEYWEPLIKNRARVLRFDDTYESARVFIDDIPFSRTEDSRGECVPQNEVEVAISTPTAQIRAEKISPAAIASSDWMAAFLPFFGLFRIHFKPTVLNLPN